MWVSGTIGDGALGLLAAQGKLDDPSGHLAKRYRLPSPRLGLAVAGLVRAAMDISDGLVQDLGHLCRASNVGGELQAAAVPLSAPAAAAGDLLRCLTGGDDYELLLAIAPEDATAFQAHAARCGIAVRQIGSFTDASQGLVVRGADGAEWPIAQGGWSHFS
jgi:thiamine-monophosphate kinase